MCRPVNISGFGFYLFRMIVCAIIVLSNAKAESARTYLRRVAFDRGTAVVLDMNGYSICTYLNQNDDNTTSIGIALWTEQEEPRTDFVINPVEKEKLSLCLKHIENLEWKLSFRDATTFELHAPRVEILVSRGSYRLEYCELLRLTNHKKQLNALLTELNHIISRNGVQLLTGNDF